MSNDRTGRGGQRGANTAQERWAEFADLILVISREIQFRGYRSQEAVSLSPNEGMVMRCLHHNPGISSSRIAHATGLQRSNISTVLRGLEEKGVIERRSAAEDGREVKVYPTPLGTRNYALVRNEWADLIATPKDADAADLDAAISVLRKVEAGLARE
ncbi:MarR family winged helix-turn-helix transcriptional regulator [Nocardia albiluteola]|uniref:MarR family winged helix-turn-helix transcriptional regulator n=1 Tax=Nocardia albiluteola TaxID=2842303 RepID=UPI0027E19D2F|nr:MarR family transcriptional regulator [Nocardia albiluteola]